MKQITVRGIPEDIRKLIKREAEKKGVSINKAFISVLEKASGKKAKEKKLLHHDLDRLSGIWTKEEAKTFQRSLALQRTIDEDLWKKEES